MNDFQNSIKMRLLPKVTSLLQSAEDAQESQGRFDANIS